MNQPHPTPWRIAVPHQDGRVYALFDADCGIIAHFTGGIDRRAAEFLIAYVNGRDDLEAEARASRAAFQDLAQAAGRACR